jgi:hypothetical protein
MMDFATKTLAFMKSNLLIEQHFEGACPFGEDCQTLGCLIKPARNLN